MFAGLQVILISGGELCLNECATCDEKDNSPFTQQNIRPLFYRSESAEDKKGS